MGHGTHQKAFQSDCVKSLLRTSVTQKHLQRFSSRQKRWVVRSTYWPKNGTITWAVHTTVTAIAFFDTPPTDFAGKVELKGSTWIFFFGIKNRSDGAVIGVFGSHSGGTCMR